MNLRSISSRLQTSLTLVAGPVTRFVFRCVMTPSVHRFVAETNNFSVPFLKGRVGEELPVVYLHLKSLIVDHGPESLISVAITCDVWKEQINLEFRHNFEIHRAVDGVVISSFSDRKQPRSSYLLVCAVSRSVRPDHSAKGKERQDQSKRHFVGNELTAHNLSQCNTARPYKRWTGLGAEF